MSCNVSGDKMEKQHGVCVVFDYTTFLGVSCKKKWTFLEAFSSSEPDENEAMSGHEPESGQDPQDRLWKRALRALSSRRSDETNLVTLVQLAKLEGISQLELDMPYALDSEQIDMIQSQSHATIAAEEPERLIIRL